MAINQLIKLIFHDFSTFYSDFLECESVLTDANGTIVSPGFPNIYDENTTCSWLIQLPIGQFIEVEFLNFSLDCRLDVYFPHKFIIYYNQFRIASFHSRFYLVPK